MEHIEDFQKLNIRVKGIPEEHNIDVFIGNLEYNIQHEVHHWVLGYVIFFPQLAHVVNRGVRGGVEPPFVAPIV